MQRRVYHDTGVSDGRTAGPQAAGQEYDGAKSKQAKKVAAQGQSSAYGVLDAFDDFLKFLDEEFWLIFFAIVYAFSLIFFLLAIVNSYAVKKNEHHASTPPSLCGDWKMLGSKYTMWNWIIGLFTPWFVVTTMYLVDPRWEQWSVAMLTKVYYRAQELRHREGLGGLKEAVARWWKWRKEYKPPRVGNV